VPKTFTKRDRASERKGHRLFLETGQTPMATPPAEAMVAGDPKTPRSWPLRIGRRSGICQNSLPPVRGPPRPKKGRKRTKRQVLTRQLPANHKGCAGAHSSRITSGSSIPGIWCAVIDWVSAA